jgi:hypothetical protein
LETSFVVLAWLGDSDTAVPWSSWEGTSAVLADVSLLCSPIFDVFVLLLSFELRDLRGEDGDHCFLALSGRFRFELVRELVFGVHESSWLHCGWRAYVLPPEYVSLRPSSHVVGRTACSVGTGQKEWVRRCPLSR